MFVCQQKECWFEQALKEKRGFVIKRMGEDGACLFRSVGKYISDIQSVRNTKTFFVISPIMP